jgi:hypothetical protein
MWRYPEVPGAMQLAPERGSMTRCSPTAGRVLVSRLGSYVAVQRWRPVDASKAETRDT